MYAQRGESLFARHPVMSTFGAMVAGGIAAIVGAVAIGRFPVLAHAASELVQQIRPYAHGATSVARDVLSRGTVTWRGMTRYPGEMFGRLRDISSEAWVRGMARAGRPAVAELYKELEHTSSFVTHVRRNLPEELSGFEEDIISAIRSEVAADVERRYAKIESSRWERLLGLQPASMAEYVGESDSTEIMRMLRSLGIERPLSELRAGYGLYTHQGSVIDIRNIMPLSGIRGFLGNLNRQFALNIPVWGGIRPLELLHISTIEDIAFAPRFTYYPFGTKYMGVKSLEEITAPAGAIQIGTRLYEVRPRELIQISGRYLSAPRGGTLERVISDYTGTSRFAVPSVEELAEQRGWGQTRTWLHKVARALHIGPTYGTEKPFYHRLGQWSRRFTGVEDMRFGMFAEGIVSSEQMASYGRLRALEEQLAAAGRLPFAPEQLAGQTIRQRIGRVADDLAEADTALLQEMEERLSRARAFVYKRMPTDFAAKYYERGTREAAALASDESLLEFFLREAHVPVPAGTSELFSLRRQLRGTLVGEAATDETFRILRQRNTVGIENIDVIKRYVLHNLATASGRGPIRSAVPLEESLARIDELFEQGALSGKARKQTRDFFTAIDFMEKSYDPERIGEAIGRITETGTLRRMSPFWEAGNIELFERASTFGQATRIPVSARAMPKLIPYYLLERPMRLREYLIGGHPPARGFRGLFKNIFLRDVLGIWMGYQGLRFADDVLDQAEIPGMEHGPIAAAAGGLVKGKEAMAAFRDITGITAAARGIEDLMPGAIKSPFAQLVRLGAPFLTTPVGRIIGGRAGGIAGLAVGIGAAAMGWGDFTQSSEELHKIHTGEKEIPVRAGRWWVLGSTPWSGGRVQYYRKHWYPRLKDKTEYEAWGGMWGYWKYNFPGIGTIATMIDPYYRQRIDLRAAAYLETGSYGYDIPLIGPMFAATVGQIIRPNIRLHPEQWERLARIARLEEMPTDKQEMLIYAQGQMPYRSTDLRYATGQTIRNLQSWAGIYGFFSSVALQKLTGSETPFTDRDVIEPATRMTSLERQFYNLQLGDPGFTELMRRYIVKHPYYVSFVNPVETALPKWAPDEEYFENFMRGSPTTHLRYDALLRTPGPELERAYGIVGEYTPLNKMLALSKMAPWSKEYRQQAAIVRQQIEAGELSDEETEQYRTIGEQVRTIKRAFDIEPYREDWSGYLPHEQLLGKLWERFTHARIPYIHNKLLPYDSAVEYYKRRHVYGAQFGEWERPIETIVKPAIDLAAEEPFGFAIARGALYGRIFGGTPAARLGMSIFGGAYLGGLSARRYMGELMTGEPYIPERTQRLREMQRNLNRLEYVKAIAEGDAQAAQRTMVGANVFGPYPAIYSALPKMERNLLEDILALEGGEREEMLGLLSPDVRRIIEAQYIRQDMLGMTEEEKRPIFRRMRAEAQRDIDYEVTRYFSKVAPLPSPEWLGWQAGEHFDIFETALAEEAGIDYHDLNLWEDTTRVAEAFDPDVPYPEGDRSIGDIRRQIAAIAAANGVSLDNVEVMPTDTGENTIELDMRKDKNRELQWWLRQNRHAMLRAL